MKNVKFTVINGRHVPPTRLIYLKFSVTTTTGEPFLSHNLDLRFRINEFMDSRFKNFMRGGG